MQRRSRSLDITKGALEKARADCARTIADLATAHQRLREAERLKKDAEAQTRRALDEAARSAQKQQDTAARLSHVGWKGPRGCPRLYVCRNGTKLRTKETISELSAKLQDAFEARALWEEAEDAAPDARDRAWRHHRSAAETKSLAVDVRRLVKLLASTGGVPAVRGVVARRRRRLGDGARHELRRPRGLGALRRRC